MKYLTFILFFLTSNCIAQPAIDKLHVGEIVDSLRTTLKTSGADQIVTLRFHRASSETVMVNDTCYDCYSAYMFWHIGDTNFLKKINQFTVFQTDYQNPNLDHGDLVVSSILKYAKSHLQELSNKRFRTQGDDIIAYDILKGDTVFWDTGGWGCPSCRNYKLTVDLPDTTLSEYWTTEAFDYEISPVLYDINMNLEWYQLYLITKQVIEHWDRNQWWVKE
jgi:hypothetical protein